MPCISRWIIAKSKNRLERGPKTLNIACTRLGTPKQAVFTISRTCNSEGQVRQADHKPSHWAYHMQRFSVFQQHPTCWAAYRWAHDTVPSPKNARCLSRFELVCRGVCILTKHVCFDKSWYSVSSPKHAFFNGLRGEGGGGALFKDTIWTAKFHFRRENARIEGGPPLSNMTQRVHFFEGAHLWVFNRRFFFWQWTFYRVSYRISYKYIVLICTVRVALPF